MSKSWYETDFAGPITYGHIVTAIIIGLVVVPAGMWVYDKYGPQTGLGDEDTEDPNPIELDIFVWVREGKGVDLPGLAGSTSDQNIEVFRDDAGGNEPGTPIWTLTTSSGKIQLPPPVLSGTTFWVQARQGAPDAADPLMSRAVKMEVPLSTGYEPNDDISLTLYVRDLTATAPTFGVEDASSNAISDNSVNYFNTTDQQFTVEIYDIDSDTYYGGENDDGLTYVTDWVNGNLWANGVFFVWKGTTRQPFNTYTYLIPFDGTNVYYIWRVMDYMIDDSKTTGKEDYFSTMLETNGNNLNADTTVVLDVYDFVQVGSKFVLLTIMDASALVNGASLNPTAITTKVA